MATEAQLRHYQKIKELWQNPEYKKKMIESNKRNQIKLWSNLEYRERQLQLLKKGFTKYLKQNLEKKKLLKPLLCACGKEFFPKSGNSPSKMKKTKYCSIKCLLQFRSYNPTENLTLKCAFCGNSFRTKRVAINKGRKYCSRSCYNQVHKEMIRGKNNPKWRGGPKKRICPICKNEFETYGKTQKFCSYKCQRRINTMKKGTTGECEAKRQLKKEGYFVIRSSGSRGLWDIIAFNDKELRLIQIKTLAKDVIIEQKYAKEFEVMKKIEVVGRQEFWIKVNDKGWRKIIVKESTNAIKKKDIEDEKLVTCERGKFKEEEVN